jgi:hypothetical protein
LSEGAAGRGFGIPPSPPSAEARRAFRRRHALAAALFALPLLFSPFMTADRRQAAFAGVAGPRCPLDAVGGLPCPGCGLTRGFVLTVHGEWRTAREVHPGAPWIVGLAFAGAVAHGIAAARGENSRLLRIGFRFGRTLFLAVVGYTVAARCAS